MSHQTSVSHGDDTKAAARQSLNCIKNKKNKNKNMAKNDLQFGG